MKEEFYFPSKDGNTEIHAVEWAPLGEVKAVLQICHGMLEYIDRYQEFADFLCKKGYSVVGNDHLGHGKSVQSNADYGFFDEKRGNACVLGDMRTLHVRIAKKYPSVPYFMLGHGMGSLLVRQYAQCYGSALSGVILLGVVADYGIARLKAGQRLCGLIAIFKGWHYRSRLVDELAVGKYNKAFNHARAKASRTFKDKRRPHPPYPFMFTVNAYYNMFGGMIQVVKKKSAYLIPKSLPMLMMAGSGDPAGNFGKGVRGLYERYQKAGIKDITFLLYAGQKHELLGEAGRGQVYKDIFVWLENRRKAS